jgi:hypothetical protein
MKTTFRAAEATRQLEHEEALRQQGGQQHHKVKNEEQHTHQHNSTDDAAFLSRLSQDYPISAGHIVTAVP